MGRTPSAALLLLADSRLPTGAHAHSGGMEVAVERGLVHDEAGLELFLAGRLRGGAEVIAAGAAAGCLLAGPAPDRATEGTPDREPDGARWDAAPDWARWDAAPDWARWDSALSARTPSAAMREASRVQGAALLRTARQVWPGAAVEALATLGRPHHPLVLGAVTAGRDRPGDAALLAVHHLIGGACSAAVRLLGLDPIAVAAVQARLGEAAERTARHATRAAVEAVGRADPALLPAAATPLPDLLAELHARAEVTLFAS